MHETLSSKRVAAAHAIAYSDLERKRTRECARDARFDRSPVAGPPAAASHSGRHSFYKLFPLKSVPDFSLGPPFVARMWSGEVSS
jgi:hypothetical protein